MPDNGNKPERNNKDIKAGNLAAGLSAHPPPPEDTSEGNLGEHLRNERKARLTERFVWILLLLLLFYFHIFAVFPTVPWLASVILSLLGLLFLAIMAEKCQLPHIAAFIWKFLRIRRFLGGAGSG